jgi:alanine racemase
MFVRPTWAEIQLDHIEHNIKQIRSILPESTAVMAVVKANAYGHGAAVVARKALSAGATYLAVHSADEGIELRQEGIQAPILVFGYTPPEGAEAVVEHRLTQTIYDEKTLEALSAAAVRRHANLVKVHLKLDTGMGRIGVTEPEDALRLARLAQELPGVELEGVFTHFATSDEPDSAYAAEQIARWNNFRQHFEKQGLEVPLWHISNSAAILQYSASLGNMVRLGISMYGYYPSHDVPHTIELRPALRLVSKIAHLKTVPAGTKISYGATYEATRETKVATIPLGYADGYSRALSNQGHALVHGIRVPVIGRVCMDQLMLDVSEVDGVEVGDEAVFYGRQGDAEIPLEEVAEQIGTITYEVCCDLGQRVPRCYVEDGRIILTGTR